MGSVYQQRPQPLTRRLSSSSPLTSDSAILPMIADPNSTIQICHLSNLRTPLRERFARSGIVPYYRYEGKIWFVLTIYSGLNHERQPILELSDFGGGADYTAGESYLTAACRECDEESFGIFQFNQETISLTSCAAWSSDNSMILLLTPSTLNLAPESLTAIWNSRQAHLLENEPEIRVPINAFSPFEDVCSGVAQRQKYSRHYKAQENAGIVVIDRQQLLDLLSGTSLVELSAAQHSAILQGYVPELYTPVFQHLSRLSGVITEIPDTI